MELTFEFPRSGFASQEKLRDSGVFGQYKMEGLLLSKVVATTEYLLAVFLQLLNI